MASAQVVETSVANNSPFQDSNHPDDLFQSRCVTPGFKPFSYIIYVPLDVRAKNLLKIMSVTQVNHTAFMESRHFVFTFVVIRFN